MRRFLFVLLPLALALPASAKPHHRTVLDYFKMLPSKRFFEFAPESDSLSERMKWLRYGLDPRTKVFYNPSVVDLKNDYIRYPGDGGQASLDVAVFRYHGKDTVAVGQSSSDVYSLSFWREQNGRLQEVTKNVFPFYPGYRDDVAFVVPQHGTTLRVLKTGRDLQPTSKVVARFHWRGGRFVRA